MNFARIAFAMAAFGTVCLVGCAYGLWRICRSEKRDQLREQRTPEDVLADAAEHRAQRDLDTCRHIWPDPPTWRTAKAQHRHDTARQRKEEGQ